MSSKITAYGYAYPFIELALGAAYLLGFGVVPAVNYACIALSLLTTGGVLRALLRKQNLQCACLGSTFSVPISGLTVAENIIMIGMAIFMLTGMHA